VPNAPSRAKAAFQGTFRAESRIQDTIEWVKDGIGAPVVMISLIALPTGALLRGLGDTLL
jgi:hypothetical protein